MHWSNLQSSRGEQRLRRVEGRILLACPAFRCRSSRITYPKSTASGTGSHKMHAKSWSTAGKHPRKRARHYLQQARGRLSAATTRPHPTTRLRLVVLLAQCLLGPLRWAQQCGRNIPSSCLAHRTTQRLQYQSTLILTAMDCPHRRSKPLASSNAISSTVLRQQRLRLSVP